MCSYWTWEPWHSIDQQWKHVRGEDGESDWVTVSNKHSFVSVTPADRKEEDLRVWTKSISKSQIQL